MKNIMSTYPKLTVYDKSLLLCWSVYLGMNVRTPGALPLMSHKDVEIILDKINKQMNCILLSRSSYPQHNLFDKQTLNWRIP